MSNPITGQSTIDIIREINCHVAINRNFNPRDIRTQNVICYNVSKRFEFNHHFNHNRYTK